MAEIIGYNNNVMLNTAGYPFYCVPSTGGKKGEYTAAGNLSTDTYYFDKHIPITGVENIPNISTYTADGSWSSATNGQVYYKLKATDFVSARISGYAKFDAIVYSDGSYIRVSIPNTIDTGKTSAYSPYNWKYITYPPNNSTIYDCYWTPKSTDDDLILQFYYDVLRITASNVGHAQLQSFNYKLTACAK